MTVLQWGRPQDKTYESGVDKGVLYLPDGSAVPWNGLTNIDEKFSKNNEAVYFDGMKISELITVGEFSASMTAVSYPKEFAELESMAYLRNGVLMGDQPPQFFALCWRTFKGDQFRGPKAYYKLHIAYNLVAIPADRSYETLSDDPSVVEFEWDLFAVPEEVEGFRPTAHLVIESEDIHPFLLEEIEAKLYGSMAATASLMPMAELVSYLYDWALVRIVVNDDDTWTAIADYPGFLEAALDISPDSFRLSHVNAYFTDLEQEEYVIADTKDDMSDLEIQVHEEAGTWDAIAEAPNMIVVDDDTGIFTIYDVDPLITGDDYFRIESTHDD